MAQISQRIATSSGLVDPVVCSFCGGHTQQGGQWITDSPAGEVTVCVSCTYQHALPALFADAVMDSGESPRQALVRFERDFWMAVATAYERQLRASREKDRHQGLVNGEDGKGPTEE